MAVPRAGARWLPAALLALSPLAAMAQPVDGCPPYSVQDNRAPHYPPSELWRLLGYTINVIIEVDACGRVTGARIERASGVVALDAAALAAARAWTVPPHYRGQPRYRLPFVFEPLPEALPAQERWRPHDPFFEERSSGRVPMPAPDAHGALPGYIADPYPIGFLQIPEAVAAIGPLALFRRYGSQANFWLRDEEGLSLFQLEGPMMVRNRLVSDGRHRFVVTSVLCGNDLEACRQALAELRAARGPQQPVATDDSAQP
ncbi:TonB family protein [Stenotrophomonas sp. MYb238]|uniref:TonB family protein n=1 Tax=Stenotrophomonas sp. MYb238 TaxID=2040281 RepID=UPI001292AAB4|nr:TonB family protein [Stenotrophomonas sp. MYb238]MQP75332.1 TonB family protein [Stenotrophomonas sp. MYb238]